MEIGRRDAFDLVLVAIALGCVLSYVVDPTGAGTPIGAVVGAVVSIDPLAYLVAFGAVGVLFLAYALLYVPTQQRP